MISRRSLLQRAHVALDGTHSNVSLKGNNAQKMGITVALKIVFAL